MRFYFLISNFVSYSSYLKFGKMKKMLKEINFHIQKVYIGLFSKSQVHESLDVEIFIPRFFLKD